MAQPPSDHKPAVAPQGLPPVTPPSGRFIAQLFLVPGLIVLVSVLLLLLFRFVFGGGYTPDYFIRQLDNANTNIRWRGAADLAQVLEKSDSLPLRCDAVFALELTQRLRVAWDDLVQEETREGPRIEKLAAGDQTLAWRKLTSHRDYVRFLIVAVARSHAPVAMPVLADIALRDKSPDIKGLTLVRRQALWALGIMGQNLREFGQLKAEFRDAILAELDKESSAAHPQRAGWAKNALDYLDRSRLASPLDDPVAMDAVLAKCADADDPYIREQVALALLYYDGPLVEPTLQKLARDDGHGTLIRVHESD